MMKAKSKEQYDKIHKPMIPKSRINRKIKMKMKSVIKHIPFIPAKDKTSNPFSISKLKRPFNLQTLLDAFTHPRVYYPTYTGTTTIYGMIKHAGEIRSIKKAQRRRSHLRSLCA